MVLEKTLEGPLDYKEIQPVHSEGDQPWDFFGKNDAKAEAEEFSEDLQDLLELTPPKHALFIIGDWNAKVGGHETPGLTGKFGLEIHNEAGQRLIEFCQENALVIANTLFQQRKRRLYT